MNILHIETATDICSVAISSSKELLDARQSTSRNSHAEVLTTLIQQSLETVALKATDLDAIAVSSGPGSYTGLRIGLSTAKGLCYALGLPLIGIPTLDALARAAIAVHEDADAYYLPMIDARRMEVYTAVYSASMEPVEPVQSHIFSESSFEHLLSAGRSLVLLGNGALKSHGLLSDKAVTYLDITCDAPHLVAPATLRYEQRLFDDVAYFAPTYHKSPNITVSKKRPLGV